MALVNGLGGAFVFSDDPARLAAWYADHFGLTFEGSGDAFYHVFWALDADRPARRLDTSFSILRGSTPRRPPPAAEPASMYGDQPFMLNLRTNDLDALVASLEARGVPVIKREDEPYGRFAWVRDADGHRVELYEPVADEPVPAPSAA